MVIGGPLAVVVASLFTVGIAVKHVDPVIEVTKTQSRPDLAPAIQGRNQAAEKAYQPARPLSARSCAVFRVFPRALNAQR